MTKILNYELINQYNRIDKENPELQIIDKIVSWEIMPSFPKIGRTAWLPLKKTIMVKIQDRQFPIFALKIKGVGLNDYNRDTIQPSAKQFITAAFPHNGIKKDGSFELMKSPYSPIGGMTLERAKTEYNISQELIENNVPSQVPIRLYKYTDQQLQFSNLKNGTSQPMGVVVTGQLQSQFFRASSILDYQNLQKEVIQSIEEFSAQMEARGEKDPQFSLLKKVYGSYGKILRQFSEAGFYRHSGDLGNFGCSSQIKSVYFTDLDGCRNLSECGEIEKPLQVIRDVASCLHYILWHFTEANSIKKYPLERILKCKFFQTFLVNYYDDISPERINCFSKILEELYIHVYESTLMHLEEIKKKTLIDMPENADEFTKRYLDRWKYFNMSQEEVFSWLMSVIAVLHRDSKMMFLYPLKTSQEDLYQNLANYSNNQIVMAIKDRINKVF